MNAIFKKLNFKDHAAIYVINAPESFRPELQDMEVVTDVISSLSAAKAIPFFLAFVTKQKEVDELAKKAGTLIAADGVVWFAYPKGTSKNTNVNSIVIMAGMSLASWASNR